MYGWTFNHNWHFDMSTTCTHTKDSMLYALFYNTRFRLSIEYFFYGLHISIFRALKLFLNHKV